MQTGFDRHPVQDRAQIGNDPACVPFGQRLTLLPFMKAPPGPILLFQLIAQRHFPMLAPLRRPAQTIRHRVRLSDLVRLMTRGTKQFFHVLSDQVHFQVNSGRRLVSVNDRVFVRVWNYRDSEGSLFKSSHS